MFWRVFMAWTYRLTVQAAFNVVFNAWHLYRIFVSGNLPRARYRLAISLAGMMSGKKPCMYYRYDGLLGGNHVLGKWPCWTALPLVFAGMGFRGNCMDGAAFMKRALGGKVRVWIPDGHKWWARVHYVCETKTGRVWSLEKKGLRSYKSLSACRPGEGRWI
jgi:hypothetical protein